MKVVEPGCDDSALILPRLPSRRVLAGQDLRRVLSRKRWSQEDAV